MLQPYPDPTTIINGRSNNNHNQQRRLTNPSSNVNIGPRARRNLVQAGG